MAEAMAEEVAVEEEGVAEEAVAEEIVVGDGEAAIGSTLGKAVVKVETTLVKAALEITLSKPETTVFKLEITARACSLC